jgi:hypothetical protein
MGASNTEPARQARAAAEVSAQVDGQRQRLAGALRASGQEMSRFAGAEGQSPLTAELARRAGGYTRGLGDYLDRADASRVLADVRSFARRRPGTFLLLAAVGGVVAGRLTKGVAAASQPDAGVTPVTAPPVVDTGASGRGGTGLAGGQSVGAEPRP